MTDRFRRKAALALTALVAAAIALLTLQPMPVPGPPGGDKLHHLLAFAALVLPGTVLWPRWGPGLFIAAVAYGGAIEIVQPHVGRGGEVRDWVADCLGAGLGLVAGLALARVWPAPPATD